MNAAPDAAPWLAQTLTRRMGRDLRPPLGGPAPGQAKARWAATGLADLTGPPDSPPIAPERDFAARLEALLRVTRAMAAMLGQPPRIEMSLYCERAADLGLTRRGSISAGGGARMVRCGDGWIAANLARPEDLDLFDAWIGAPAGADPWGVLAASAARFKAAEMIAAGRLLGLPVSEVDAGSDAQRAARPGQRLGAPRVRRWGESARAPRDPAALLVVDLSGLWAGPLCGRLFVELGARVVKVESARRPDGARAGPAAFFERMNGGKHCVSLDLAAEAGKEALRRLIRQADVVIEAARPRAMAQFGLEPESFARERPHLVWISLTAYGRTGPWSNAVGFGDDCAASAGLIVRGAVGEPLFVGDAIADPIGGLMAASAGFAALAAGVGALIDVGLREASWFVAQAPSP